MYKPFLSIIIPAYNEAERLPLTLIDIDKHLSGQDYSYEILVINDGSTDNTAEITEKFMPMVKGLKIFDNKENQGKGAAVRQGMLIAKGNWRLFMDADNSTAISEFNKMLPYLKEGYDIVIGSRAVRGAILRPPQSLYKRFLGKLGNFFVRIILVPGLKDTQCGFKCFSEESVERVFSIARIKRWGFDFEALALARLFGYKIKEMPVTWVNDPRTHVRFSSYFKTLWEALKIKWWLVRNKYGIRRP